MDDYKSGARVEFSAVAGKKNYQAVDGGSDADTGVPVTDSGVSVSITLTDADTYDLEITTLGDKKTTTLKGRKLAGSSGGSIESFCITNRNGEKSDGFFNGFQIIGPQ